MRKVLSQVSEITNDFFLMLTLIKASNDYLHNFKWLAEVMYLRDIYSCLKCPACTISKLNYLNFHTEEII